MLRPLRCKVSSIRFFFLFFEGRVKMEGREYFFSELRYLCMLQKWKLMHSLVCFSISYASIKLEVTDENNEMGY